LTRKTPSGRLGGARTACPCAVKRREKLRQRAPAWIGPSWAMATDGTVCRVVALGTDAQHTLRSELGVDLGVFASDHRSASSVRDDATGE
jgi:hypothetical protein